MTTEAAYQSDAALLFDVARSGVENDDPRLSYVVVQIDTDTWRVIQERWGPSGNAEPGASS